MRRPVFLALILLASLGSARAQVQPVATFPGRLTVVGSECNITSLASATNFIAAGPAGCGSIPTGALYAQVQAQSQAVNFTFDGSTTPTTTLGTNLAAGSVGMIQMSDLTKVQFIQAAASATLHVIFLK